MADFFNRTITESLQYGLTSIHDADTSPARIAFFRKYAAHLHLRAQFLTRDVQTGRRRPPPGGHYIPYAHVRILTRNRRSGCTSWVTLNQTNTGVAEFHACWTTACKAASICGA